MRDERSYRVGELDLPRPWDRVAPAPIAQPRDTHRAREAGAHRMTALFLVACLTALPCRPVLPVAEWVALQDDPKIARRYGRKAWVARVKVLDDPRLTVRVRVP